MAASSDIGSVRKENEDFYYFSSANSFMLVCDGMGGHQKGAQASKMCGETVRDIMFSNQSGRKLVLRNHILDIGRICEDVKYDLPDHALKLVAGIRLANRRIFKYALHDKKMLGMGTTIVGAIVHEGHLIVAHVGDSRLYRLRNGVLTMLTTDHSWLNELLEDREITEKEVQNFRKKNVLTRALGIAPAVKIDLQITPVAPNDLYLLCSDGLSNALQDELIHSILGAYHGSLQNKVSNLVTRAKMMDGSDNITAGLLHITGQWRGGRDLNQSIRLEEQPEVVSDYLDQELRNIYPIRQSGTKLSARRLGIASLAAAAVLLFSLILFFAKRDQSGQATAQSNTGVQQSSSRPLPAATPQRKAHEAYEAGGRLVLLQIDHEQSLHMLEGLEGIRILDTVSEFDKNVPVYAGRFTWAVADSRERILYKRRNLHVKPVAASQPTGSSGVSGGSHTLTPSHFGRSDEAHVFLSGDFHSARYRDAFVFINEQPFGALSRYKDSGFYLQGGVYTIKITDGQNRVLKTKSDIAIKDGETIAIEF